MPGFASVRGSSAVPLYSVSMYALRSIAIDRAWRTLTSLSAPFRLQMTSASDANDGPAATVSFALALSWSSVVSGWG